MDKQKILDAYKLAKQVTKDYDEIITATYKPLLDKIQHGEDKDSINENIINLILEVQDKSIEISSKIMLETLLTTLDCK